MKSLLLALLLAAPTLPPVSVTLPDDDAIFAGPDADLLNANCTACHSSEMVLTQPLMTEQAWAASVAKMRTIYKAPIEDADAAALPAALARAQRR